MPANNPTEFYSLFRVPVQRAVQYAMDKMEETNLFFICIFPPAFSIG